jgi:branched-chain amino acid transport system substrate-binding protein
MRIRTAPVSPVQALCTLALLLLTLGLLAACSGGGGRDTSLLKPGFGPDGQPLSGQPGLRKPSVKVAFLLPLSAQGNTASVAEAMKQAGELALFDFNSPNVTLLAKDTRGTPEGAKAAALAAVAAGAELIVGPLFAKSVSAAAPVARQAGVPMVAFSSDRSVAGDGVYLLSFLAGRDVPRIVSYSIRAGKRRFAALIPKGAYGNIVAQSFQSAVTQQGGQIAALERLPHDANGMLEPTKRVAALAKSEDPQIPPQVDAIFIPAGPESLPTISALLPYYEIDTSKVQIIGTGLWDYPNIGKEKPLVGGWFPAPDPKGWRSFTQRYVKTYEKTPPRLASLAYDAVALVVSLSSNPKGERYTPRQLTRPSGFAGVDGLFRLLPDGTSQRGLAVLEVQKFDNKVIDPAPSSFSAAQF